LLPTKDTKTGRKRKEGDRASGREEKEEEEEGEHTTVSMGRNVMAWHGRCLMDEPHVESLKCI